MFVVRGGGAAYWSSYVWLAGCKGLGQDHVAGLIRLDGRQAVTK